MSHPQITLFAFTSLLVLAIGVKLGWDEYQQTRAQAKVPTVRAIFGGVNQFPGAAPDDVYDEFSISVNEYSTSLWQSFRTEAASADIRTHFDREMVNSGFAIAEEYSSAGKLRIEYRQGEFETRLLFDRHGYDFNVNWPGLDR